MILGLDARMISANTSRAADIISQMNRSAPFNPYSVFQLGDTLNSVHWPAGQVIQIAPIAGEDDVEEILSDSASVRSSACANEVITIPDDPDVVCVFSANPHVIAPIEEGSSLTSPIDDSIDNMLALRSVYNASPMSTVVDNEQNNHATADSFLQPIDSYPLSLFRITTRAQTTSHETVTETPISSSSLPFQRCSTSRASESVNNGNAVQITRETNNNSVNSVIIDSRHPIIDPRHSVSNSETSSSTNRLFANSLPASDSRNPALNNETTSSVSGSRHPASHSEITSAGGSRHPASHSEIASSASGLWCAPSLSQLSGYTLVDCCSPTSDDDTVSQKTKDLSKAGVLSESNGSYKCSLCSFQNNNKASAMRHIEAHSDKTKTCPYCERAFVDTGNRKRHIEKHLKVNLVLQSDSASKTTAVLQEPQHQNVSCVSYKCSLCHLSFFSYSSLYKHLKRKHNRTSIDERENNCTVDRDAVISTNQANMNSGTTTVRSDSPSNNIMLERNTLPLVGDCNDVFIARVDTYEQNILLSSKLTNWTVSFGNEVKLTGVVKSVQHCKLSSSIPSVCSIEEAKGLVKRSDGDSFGPNALLHRPPQGVNDECSSNSFTDSDDSLSTNALSARVRNLDPDRLDCVKVLSSKTPSENNYSSNQCNKKICKDAVCIANRLPLFVREEANTRAQKCAKKVNRASDIDASQKLRQAFKKYTTNKSAKWHKCDQCNYQTLNRSCLRLHCRVHKFGGNIKRPNSRMKHFEKRTCRLCLANFWTSSDLIVHWVQHKKDIVNKESNKFECCLCECEKVTIEQLFAHMKSHM